MRRITAVLSCILILAMPATAAEPADGSPTRGLELLEAGRYEAALPYFQRDLDRAETRYGTSDPAIAVEINNLAEVYRRSGQLDQAAALYRRAIAVAEKGGSGHNVILATSLNNLALVARAQNRLDEAERLNLRALALLEQALGLSHPDVAKSLHNLAALYQAQGAPERARPLQERAVAIAESTLGPQHPNTEQFRRRLATLNGSSGSQGNRATAASPVARPRAELPQVPDAPTRAPSFAEPAAGPGRQQAQAAPAGDGSFAVQVAAVPEREQVAAEWRRLARRFPFLGDLELQAPQAVEIVGKGTFYRVLGGPFGSRADAEAACAQLVAAGAACRLARL